MEEDYEAPSTSNFFSRRAKFNPIKTAEKLQAASELVDQIQEETVIPIKKTRTKGVKTVKSHPAKDIKNITDDLESISDVKLSAASKKKLKQLREEQERELYWIEVENQKILSSAVDVSSIYSNESVKDTDEDFEKIAVLTISHMSTVSRLKCYENDKFVDIFPKVAKSFDLGVTEFLLCLRERNISIDDTPKSLKLTDQDVLECIPYKIDANSKAETEDSGNTFRITFQSNDSKTKIDMLVHKLEKMEVIMKRYSEQRNIPLNQLTFDFDGERLSGDETPVDLDMESGNCIDVTVIVPKVVVTKKKPRRKKRKW